MTLQLNNIRKYTRVMKLCAAVLLSVTAYQIAGNAPANAAEIQVTKPGFAVRDATRFLGNPDLAKHGMRNVVVAYESALWSKSGNPNEPDLKHIKSVYIPKLRLQNPDVLIIDIERWPLGVNTTATERTATINKLKKVISLFRTEMPKLKLGYYMLMPERNYLAPAGDPKKAASRTKSWHERNLALMPLANVVDIIIPSLYTFGTDTVKWQKYAIANLQEAKIYGKPVWPFLWMKYRDGVTDIPAAFWRQQLETVYKYADNVVFWSMASSRITFSTTMPWFKETQAFMKQKLIK